MKDTLKAQYDAEFAESLIELSDLAFDMAHPSATFEYASFFIYEAVEFWLSVYFK